MNDDTEIRACASPGTVLARLALGNADLADRPDLPGGKEMRRYLVAALLAALPCYALATRWFGSRLWLMWLVAFVAGAAVEIVVGLVRRRPIGGGALVYAALFALTLPPTLPLWMVAMGMMFGVLFGKEAFGGTGSHIFSPVLVAKGFLLFSYPTRVMGVYFGNLLDLNTSDTVMAAANTTPLSLPTAWLAAGAVTLLAILAMAVARPANLNILVGILLAAAMAAMGFASAGMLPHENVIRFLGSDGFLLGACFLACDPAISPRNNAAKWLYGLLIGAVAVLMRTFSTYSEAMLCAVLLGNLFAPTLDLLAAGRPEGGQAS